MRECLRIGIVIICVLYGSVVFAQDATLEPLPSVSFQGPASLVPVVVSTFHAPRIVSQAGAKFIKEIEGFRPTAYRDTKGYSIGYGFQTWEGKRTTRTYPGRITQAQADREFDRQIVSYEIVVDDALGDLKVTQYEFDALVSIAYNRGMVNKTILSKLLASRRVTVSDFVVSARVRQRVHPVVYGRRLREYVVFLGYHEEALMLPIQNWRQMHQSYARLTKQGVGRDSTTPQRLWFPTNARPVAPTRLSLLGASSGSAF